MNLDVKRTTEAAEDKDGTRLLVDRIWPRGVRKDTLRLDGWLKDVAPSTELRKWFAHDPAKWESFRQKYFAELDAKPEALKPLVTAMGKGKVTLLYSARDREHNQAIALREYLQAHLKNTTR